MAYGDLINFFSNLNKGVLKKRFVEYTGSVVNNEYVTGQNTIVGGECLKIDNNISSGLIVGTSVSIVEWTQELEDVATGATLPPPPYANNFSISLDGIDEFIDMGNIADKDKLDPFSIIIWFKTVQVGTAHYINRIKSSTPFTGYQFYKDGSQKLNFALINDNSTNILHVKGGTVVNDGAWHMAVVTIDGSSNANGALIYLDAVLETMVTVTDTLNLSTLFAQNLLVGKRSDGSGYVDGKMDEIAIFDRKLSAAEIATFYNAGLTADLSDGDLHVWSRFTQTDKDNFPVIADNSTNSRNGTAANMEVGDIQGDVPL